ncbi:ABC transporter substrate-binding protein [Sphingomonas sp. RS2018]
MIGRLLLVLSAALPTAAGAPAPRRIVSVTLCADQMLLAVADRRQIAGLSRFATDRSLSAAADRAGGLPIVRDTSESLLVARPDMIVAIPQYRSATMARLRYRPLDLPSAETYGAITEQLRAVGQAVGHPERAAALVARMDARLAVLPRNPGRGRVAAYYQRRGYMTGTGTLVDDLMRRVGLVNLAGKLGKPMLSQLSVEEMVAARPDVLVMERGTATVTDQGSEMLHHPALRGIPVLWIPQTWTVCGGPDYVRAAESLTRQLRALDR